MEKTPWPPDKEDYKGDDIYPGLLCWNKMQSGSICAAPIRLPLWAFVGEAVCHGFDSADASYDITEHSELTSELFASFLYDLLEARGEFGRLLLTLAAVQREECIRDEQELQEHFRTVKHNEPNICDCEDGPSMLPWWEREDLKEKMREQLQRCLNTL